jgi:hypothetical protein
VLITGAATPRGPFVLGYLDRSLRNAAYFPFGPSEFLRPAGRWIYASHTGGKRHLLAVARV